MRHYFTVEFILTSLVITLNKEIKGGNFLFCSITIALSFGFSYQFYFLVIFGLKSAHGILISQSHSLEINVPPVRTRSLLWVLCQIFHTTYKVLLADNDFEIVIENF